MIVATTPTRVSNIESVRLVRSSALAVGLWGPIRSGTASDRMRRTVLLHLVDGTREIARAAGERLMEGVRNVAGWFAEFMTFLAPRYDAAARIVAGVPDPAEPSDSPVLPESAREPLRRRTAEQWSYLAGFAAGVLSGRVPLDGRVIARAELYARAIWSVAEKVLRDTVKRIVRRVSIPLFGGPIDREFRARFAGMTEERRILHVSQHCGDCPPLADLGWCPIGTLPDIGDTECMINCHCSFSFR